MRRNGDSLRLRHGRRSDKRNKDNENVPHADMKDDVTHNRQASALTETSAWWKSAVRKT
jgi:hypothetical protein